VISSSGGRGMSTRPERSDEPDRALGLSGTGTSGRGAIIRSCAGAMMSAPVGGGSSLDAERVLLDGMSSSASRSYTGFENVVEAP
ncbi:hypothetical protein PENTCL1PPCAC_24148, partial [Pristionchus entomophagus]